MEKVELDFDTYFKLKNMLQSSEDDFDLACELIKNMDISPICLILLNKSLLFGRRESFKKLSRYFHPKLLTLIPVEGNMNYSWIFLFPLFK